MPYRFARVTDVAVTTVDSGPRKVSRRVLVHAPAAQIFALIADPRRHPELDGSGTVRDSEVAGPDRLSVGARFTVGMRAYGVPYKITSTVTAYSDDQVGAAVRNLHEQCRDSLGRYLRLAPVIDGVEGTFTKLDSNDPASVKLLGNVPVNGKAPGGVLRHKGWKAEKIDLPPIAPSSSAVVIAPAEVEIE